ncbi:MAG: lytic transglycosylase [Candidatus Methylomirabilia bacterium]
MEYAKTRAKVTALLAGILAMLAVAVGPALGADEAAITVATSVATEAVTPEKTAGSVPAAADEALEGTRITAPVVPVESASTSTVPAAVAPPDAVPAPVPVEGAAPAVSGTLPEGLPERVETTPVLVGPNDDKLLQEVEKHVIIVPAEPAIKIAEPAYDIPLDLNTKVLDYVEIFQTTRRRSFEAGLLRSRKFEALMKPIFAEYGIPTDLYYLALIESGFNPKAYSSARAMGVWQFITSTGRLYGLRRTNWLDERRDPEKATRAAARHLKDLFDEFGSWPLAFAAYNAGRGRVQRAITKAGTNDFWSLELPGETRNYVPAFFAALIIAKDPERYGFQLEYERLEPTEIMEVGGGTRLSLVAALCRTSVDTIQDLNPELRKSTVPPGGKYALKIPAGRTEALVAGLAKVPAGRTTVGQSTYRVAPGDTLFSIAQRFGTSASAIREAARMKGSDIRPGQELVIPGLRLAEAPIPRAPGRVVVSSALPQSYRVRSGDNPWSIARRFNVPLADLLAWNDLDTDTVLKIGQSVALREPAAGTATARSARGGRTYEVRRGDNLWQISRKFDAPVEELLRLNGFSSGHDLQPGDRLLIP